MEVERRILGSTNIAREANRIGDRGVTGDEMVRVKVVVGFFSSSSSSESLVKLERLILGNTNVA